MKKELGEFCGIKAYHARDRTQGSLIHVGRTKLKFLELTFFLRFFLDRFVSSLRCALMPV